jgi:hypothetical protein
MNRSLPPAVWCGKSFKKEKMPKPRIIAAHQLKAGDRFSFIPDAWFGPGMITKSYGRRVLLADADWLRHLPKYGKKRVEGLWTLYFDNDNVVNPPGVWYGHPETRVHLLRRGGKRGIK